MHTEPFTASTQYNDMTGTAAADNHGERAMLDYLKEQNLVHQGERVCGVKMYSGEVNGKTQESPVYVDVYLTTKSFDDLKAELAGGPFSGRKLSITMHLNVFFGLFKRFEVCISSGGLLDGIEVPA